VWLKQGGCQRSGMLVSRVSQAGHRLKAQVAAFGLLLAIAALGVCFPDAAFSTAPVNFKGLFWTRGEVAKWSSTELPRSGMPESTTWALMSCMTAASAGFMLSRRKRALVNARTTTVRIATQASGPSGELWFPRTSGWTEDELAAERQRVETEVEDPPPTYNGPRYEGPASVTDAFLDQLIAMQEKGTILPKKFAYRMVLDVINVLRKEKTVGEVSIPAGGAVTVVGDLHGQYWDFMNILKLAGRPSPAAPFVFNGDFVDRGSWSIEVISVLFAFKLKDPNFVFMNRGNHEMLETNILYGFCGECGAKYDMQLFDLFSESFRNLPLAHLIEKKALVLHAGLPGPDPRIWMPGQTHDPTDAIPMSNLKTLGDLAAIDRYAEVTPEDYPQSLGPSTQDKDTNTVRMLIDILWGDPRGGIGYGPSYRKGKGVYMFGPDVTKTFCEQNNLQCIVRSHEVKAAGFRWDHPELLTVFSAPNYLDTGNNKGAFLRITKPATDGPLKLEPTSFTSVEHPDLPPMHWQEVVMESYSHLTRRMKKKVDATSFDEFGDSDFEGLMNFDEWEPEEADQFQEAFRVDEYGRDLAP